MNQNSRSLIATRVPVTPLPTAQNQDTNTIEVRVGYDEGGISYWDGSRKPRGFYLSITPVTIKKNAGGNGINMTQFTVGDGVRRFIAEANRFNAKKLETLTSEATQHPDYTGMLNHVLAKHQLQLVS